ncbi:MAG: Gfo/Idh/MocA family protein [Gemmatimonadaceae bacterium]
MNAAGGVRWGIIGTANIARGQFLPGLRSAGGVAAAVAGRDAARTQQWASDNGVERPVTGYQALIDDPSIDALYIPLPNSLHAEWTIRALEAGKPVLCEKPLCGTLRDTQRVLATARQTGTLLWESFVFPFQPQMAAIEKLVADGAIGELKEIKSNFHFMVRSPTNIRMSRELEGGALNDVGCYPIRLAQLIFGPDHESAWSRAVVGGDGVDVDTWGVLGYSSGHRLMLSAGMMRSYDTATSLEGTNGQIRVTNPFHPGAGDSYQVATAGTEPRTLSAGADEPSFTAAIRHINAVIRGEEEPRLLAVDTSLAMARALDDLAQSFSQA